MRATVTTPATPKRPQNYLWDALDKAGATVKDLDLLDAHAAKHGYAADGQIRRALAEKRAELSGDHGEG